MYSYIVHAYIIIIVMICLKKLTSLLSYYLPRYNFTLILKRLYFSALIIEKEKANVSLNC